MNPNGKYTTPCSSSSESKEESSDLSEEENWSKTMKLVAAAAQPGKK